MKSPSKKEKNTEVTASIETVSQQTHKTRQEIPDSIRHSDPKEKVKGIFTAKVHRLASWIKGSAKKD
jgi:hypothetical protein